jgi:hypothetical protein
MYKQLRETRSLLANALLNLTNSLHEPSKTYKRQYY